MVEWRLGLDRTLTYTPSTDLSPYSFSCQILGALQNQPYVFDAAANGGVGSAPTREISNQSNIALSCGTFVRQAATVEVIPDYQEI
jgi:hypothetical protein